MKRAVLCFCCVFFGGLALIPWTGFHPGVQGPSDVAEEQDGIAPADFTDEIQRKWKIVVDTPDSKGWDQTGEMQMDLMQAMLEVEILMKSCGYVERHSVGGFDNGYVLTQYEARGDKKVIWSLRRVGAKQTSFSWGWSK